MSKIFEALENAEKQRLRKVSSSFLKPKEEKKASSVPEAKEATKEAKTETPAPSRAPEAREVKKAAPVMGPVAGPTTTPPPTPTPSRAPEPQEVKRSAPVMGPVGGFGTAPFPKPKEEQKASSVPETKEATRDAKPETPASSRAPEAREVNKAAPVMGPVAGPTT